VWIVEVEAGGSHVDPQNFSEQSIGVLAIVLRIASIGGQNVGAVSNRDMQSGFRAGRGTESKPSAGNGTVGPP